MDDSISQQDRHRQPRRPKVIAQVEPIKEYHEQENQDEKLDTWKNAISAKEKTGVDPLSQVGLGIFINKCRTNFRCNVQ